MKLCVFGAGAIGGHLAGRFAKAGVDVSVVARGAQLAAIQEKGLTVQTPEGDLHCTPKASADPAELGPQDVVVVSVKAPSLPQLAGQIAPLLGPDTAVAFVMNGIPWWYFDKHGGPQDGRRIPVLDPDDVVRKAIGVERVIGGVIYSACEVVAPGVVHSEHSNNRLFLGEVDGRITPRLQALAATLDVPDFKGIATADIRGEVWAKLLNNIANGALCLLSRKSIGATYGVPVVHDAAVRCMDEAMAIARAYGVPLAGMDAAKRVGTLLNNFHRPSILQDLELGRPMEIDAILKVPLEMAREAGVPTPTLDLTVALAAMAAQVAGCYPE